MKCWIEKNVLRAIESESQRMVPKETGGLLLGYWSDNEVVITNATMPGPRARHRKSSYFPDSNYDGNIMAEFYFESGGITTYLGDWHSHPKGGGGLSRHDLITLFNIATYEPARATNPIMMIEAKEQSGWVPVIWRGDFDPAGDTEYCCHLASVEMFVFTSK